MQANIHPEYTERNFTCNCGNVVVVRSTMAKDMNIDVCNKCHPFYTGKQKIVDTAGRVDRFKRRFGVSLATAAATKDKTDSKK